MPTKIRLQRHGKKGKPFYHVVIADSRAPRDGKYIEKIGIYDPNTNPATIEINMEKALEWLQVGAIPTNTVNAILKYRGVMYKNHLLKGVAKGAFSEAEADKRFDAWLREKEAKVQTKIDSLSSYAKTEAELRFEAEAEVNAKRANEIAARKIKESEEAQVEAAEAIAEAVVEEVVEEAIVEAVVEEAIVEAVVEAVVEEAAAETVAEVKEEAPKAEKKEEAPKAEKKEEAPKAEKKEEAPKAAKKE
jgi:small subunit ribosomal protein S16